jgi:hypothetical protein
VFVEHVAEGSQHRFNVQVYKNVGNGGAKLKADRVKYCDMTGSGRDDYIWASSTGRMTLYPNAGKTIISGTESYWGPSTVIFRPRDFVDRDFDRRDLHLADWDGDGKCDIIWVNPENQNRVSVFLNRHTLGGSWTWLYQPYPAPTLSCPEKRGPGLHDLAVRFADILGNGRGDYLCIEKNGRVSGWTHNNDGSWTYIDQFKSSKGHDRADLRWADVNGEAMMILSGLTSSPAMRLCTKTWDHRMLAARDGFGDNSRPGGRGQLILGNAPALASTILILTAIDEQTSTVSVPRSTTMRRHGTISVSSNGGGIAVTVVGYICAKTDLGTCNI